MIHVTLGLQDEGAPGVVPKALHRHDTGLPREFT